MYTCTYVCTSSYSPQNKSSPTILKENSLYFCVLKFITKCCSYPHVYFFLFFHDLLEGFAHYVRRWYVHNFHRCQTVLPAEFGVVIRDVGNTDALVKIAQRIKVTRHEASLSFCWRIPHWNQQKSTEYLRNYCRILKLSDLRFTPQKTNFLIAYGFIKSSPSVRRLYISRILVFFTSYNINLSSNPKPQQLIYEAFRRQWKCTA